MKLVFLALDHAALKPLCLRKEYIGRTSLSSLLICEDSKLHWKPKEHIGDDGRLTKIHPIYDHPRLAMWKVDLIVQVVSKHSASASSAQLPTFLTMPVSFIGTVNTIRPP
jgi:hypothetical protein